MTYGITVRGYRKNRVFVMFIPSRAWIVAGSESEDEVDITRSVAEGLKKFRQDHEEAERRRNEIKRR